MEELADLLDSVPMPAGSRPVRASDNESTEEMAAGGHEVAAAADGAATGALPRRRNDPTQPIKVLGFAPDRPLRHDVSAAETARPAADGTAASRPSITSASALGPGAVLAGRYVVVEQVRHRGMGLVYKALDRQREKAGSPLPWVALKFASETDCDRAEMSACLRQEFLKLSQLNHPNVVSVFDLACHGELDFIVMEWLDGETLASALEQMTSKRLALDKAADIVRNAASALAHAHDLGIVHGDIKPSNIMVKRTGNAKIIDIGSAMDLNDMPHEKTCTPQYAAPEVLDREEVTPRSDLASAGYVLVELLAGRPLFAGIREFNNLLEAKRTLPQRLHKVLP
ncbi:MAG: serine/threonine-protein kinase, partial [Planctomycetaceae bacterium]